MQLLRLARRHLLLLTFAASAFALCYALDQGLPIDNIFLLLGSTIFFSITWLISLQAHRLHTRYKGLV